MRIDSGGKVGIGTAAPKERLEVNNDAATAIVRIMGTGATTAKLLFGGSTHTNASVGIAHYSTGTGTGHLAFLTSATDGALTEQLRITSAGLVGIGTTGPGAKLEVNLAGAEGAGIKVLSGASNKYATIEWGRTATEASLGVSRSSGAFFTGSVAGDAWLGSSNGTIGFGDITAGTASLIIKSGNVGIGTTTPGYKLHIAGTGTGAQFEIENTTASTGKKYLLSSLDAGGLTISQDVASPIVLTIKEQDEFFKIIHGGTGKYLSCNKAGAVETNMDLSANGFGCNGATPQTAYASGGAVVPGAGAYGFDSAVHAAALATLVTNIRLALVANGIMS
jgi:hypothetical protein